MRQFLIPSAALYATVFVAACSGNSPVSAPIPKVTATPAATSAPTGVPTAAPTAVPTIAPSAGPTATAGPTSAPTATAAPTAGPTATPTTAPSAQPQVVHIGFGHASATDPTFGAIAYYTGTSGASDPASIVKVVHGSQIVFTSDASQPPHTASGLGSSGFPASFDNTGGTTATGTTIDGGTTWSTGTLDQGGSSAAFTVGPAGDYYFGCFYHYSSGMRDVIVSQ